MSRYTIERMSRYKANEQESLQGEHVCVQLAIVIVCDLVNACVCTSDAYMCL